MEFVKLAGPAGVFFIMFALGLNLTIRNFIKVFKSFENIIVGLICQIIILPIIGLILISLIDLTPEFQFGVFLLLIMPSAAMSNYATKLVNGNVSLSVVKIFLDLELNLTNFLHFLRTYNLLTNFDIVHL